ncbi:hypothetical protein [Paenibacillus odorifer]|uniref:hypothetical protein n=1 Tax=Paenibacillus TaxID=44249 RepID=UPI00096F1904|nr:hypothetical protein [Paenibacillus odorifer]OME27043.1 hypothetical protein BSK57_04795 [Paenibacillus odorifer]OME33914.1 hypothetical protein BSK63_08830 [Paenibacillus odorifer]OME39040.1 hypothetical protein BSK46_12880 [Paenibacillus odorifer]
MNKYLLAFIWLPLILFTSGCTSSAQEYGVSSINAEIPIPKNAKEIEVITNSNNPNIKIGAKYELDNIGGEQGLYRPDSYFNKLSDDGWIELEDKRLGHVQFFEKKDTVIAIEIHEDSFDIHEMNKDAKF